MHNNNHLPWAGMPNVKCTITRANNGDVLGKCVIVPPGGGGPIVLTAQASEQRIAQMMRTSMDIARKVAGSEVVKNLARQYQAAMANNGQPQPYIAVGGAHLPLKVQQQLKRRSRILRKRALRAGHRVPFAPPRATRTKAAVAARKMAMQGKKLMHHAQLGNRAAMQRLTALVARAKGGDKLAGRQLRALRAMHRPAARVPALPRMRMPTALPQGLIATPTRTGDAAVAGMHGQAPMSLNNYYQIEGMIASPGVPMIVAGAHLKHTHDLRMPDYHCTPDVRTVQTTAAGCVTPAGWDIVGAHAGDWDGTRWLYNELRPHLGIRGEGQGFGLRDALVLGMQTNAQRALMR